MSSLRPLQDQPPESGRGTQQPTPTPPYLKSLKVGISYRTSSGMSSTGAIAHKDPKVVLLSALSDLARMAVVSGWADEATDRFKAAVQQALGQ